MKGNKSFLNVTGIILLIFIVVLNLRQIDGLKSEFSSKDNATNFYLNGKISLDHGIYRIYRDDSGKTHIVLGDKNSANDKKYMISKVRNEDGARSQHNYQETVNPENSQRSPEKVSPENPTTSMSLKESDIVMQQEAEGFGGGIDFSQEWQLWGVVASDGADIESEGGSASPIDFQQQGGERSAPEETPTNSLERAMQRVPNEKRQRMREEIIEAAGDTIRKDALIDLSGKLTPFAIRYPAYTSDVKGIITAFVDPTCPHCKRLHNDLGKLRMKGYSVHYLPIPREGMGAAITPQIAYASCLSGDEAVDVMDGLYNGDRLDMSGVPEGCVENIKRYLDLAVGIGAESTPFVISDTGRSSSGYSDINTLLSQLYPDQ